MGSLHSLMMRVLIAMMALALSSGCSNGESTDPEDTDTGAQGPGGETDTNGEGQGDVDSDSDTDQDTGTDTNTDTDTDTDTNTDTETQPQTGVPIFNIDSGTYNRILEVVISPPSPHAAIYYTVDGSNPTVDSPMYHDGDRMVVSTSLTIKAMAIEEGMSESDVVAADYVIEGLRIMTLRSKLDITEFEFPGGLVVEGDYAYISGHDGDVPDLMDARGGLAIVDVSNPDNPAVEGAYIRNGYLSGGLDYSDDWIYMSNDANGVVSIRVTDRANPQQHITYDSFSLGVSVVGDRLYSNEAHSGQLILDISTPGSMSYLERWNVKGIVPPASPDADVTYGTNIYNAETDIYHALAVFDIEDPTVPVMVGTYDIPGQDSVEWIQGLTVHNDHALIGIAGGGVEVIDVSDPQNPTRVNELPSLGGAVHGDLLFSSTDIGLLIHDISDPANPQWVGQYAPLPGASAMAVDDGFIYITYNPAGLSILSYE